MAQLDPWEVAPPATPVSRDPWEADTQAPPGVVQDVAQTLPTGIYHGVTGLATLPGNIDDTAMHIGHWLAEKIAGKPLPMPGRLGEGVLPTAPQLEQRLGQDIPALTKLPEAQTGVGKFTEGVASFVPGALAMPAKSAMDVAGNLVKYAVTPEVAGKTAKTGAALVGASPVAQDVAEGIGQIVGSGRGVLKDRPPSTPLTTMSEVKQGVDELYTAVRAKGVVYTPQSYQKFANDIGQTLSKMKVDPTLHPKAAAVLGKIDQMVGSSPDWEEVDQIRRITTGAMAGASPDDSRLLGVIKRSIDGYVNNAKTGVDLSAGDMTGVPEMLTQARAMRVQQERMDIVSQAYRDAELSAVGQTGDMDKALSNEFRKIAKNDDLFRTFTPDQQAAIEEVVRKSRTERVGAFLEQFANPRSPRTGLIGMGLGGAASAALGFGPAIGAAAVPAVGMVGRAIAQGVTEGQAADVANKVAGGLKRAPWQAAPRLPFAVSNTLGNMATMPPPGR